MRQTANSEHERQAAQLREALKIVTTALDKLWQEIRLVRGDIHDHWLYNPATSEQAEDLDTGLQYAQHIISDADEDARKALGLQPFDEWEWLVEADNADTPVKVHVFNHETGEYYALETGEPEEWQGHVHVGCGSQLWIWTLALVLTFPLWIVPVVAAWAWRQVTGYSTGRRK